MRRAVPIAALALLLVSPHAARAAWPVDPYVNVPLSTGSGLQLVADVAADGAGGAYVALEDTRSSAFRVVVQHVLASGAIAPGWPADGVVMPFVANGQRAPRVVASGTGCIVVWTDFRASPTNTDIFAHRLTATGGFDPAWPVTGRQVSSTANRDFAPAVATDDAGGAWIVWNEDFTITDRDVRASRVLAGGGFAPGVPAGGLSIAVSGQDQVEPAVTSDGANGAWITWADDTPTPGGNKELYVQHVRQDAVQLLTPGGVAITSPSGFGVHNPALAYDGAGGAWIAFEYLGVGQDLVVVQRVNVLGASLFGNPGTLVRDRANDSRYVKIVADAANGAYVAWEDYRDGFANAGTYVRRVLPTGGAVWPPDGVRAHADAGNTFTPALTTDGAGGVIVSWDGSVSSDGGASPLRAQRLSPLGTRLWGPNGAIVCGANLSGSPQLAPDGRGGAIAAWWDYRASAVNQQDAYAQRVDRFGAVGDAEPAIVGVSDVPADQGGAVSLQWTASPLDRTPDGVVARYSLWRRVPGGTMAAARRSGAVVVGMHDAAEPGVAKLWREDRTGAEVVYWEFVASRPAGALPGYSAVLATTSDSSAAGNPLTAFLVRAENESGTAWWDAAPDSGYSVDNVAPPMPAPFTGLYSGGTSLLAWGASPAPDVVAYRLHRGTTSSFVPGPGNLVAETAGTGHTDAAGAPYWYQVAAVDVHGNVSPYARVLPAGAVGVDDATPTAFALSRPRPLPARGPVTFDLSLPHAEDVAVEVFDAAGRRVRTLANGSRAAGVHALVWDGRDDGGATAGAGLYFVRVRAGTRGAERRVVLTR